jgi:hypothetical protein
MRAQEFVGEKWSQKYKSSINCANPKGFSQRAHCAGRRKNEDLNEFAPDGWDKDNGCDPTFYSDVEKLKKVARQLASRSVNSGWYDLQLKTLISGLEQCYGIMIDDLDDMFPTAPEISNYIERNIVKRWADGSTNKNYKPRVPNAPPGMSEEHLDELSFKGSPCTKDCSGHRAGYEWSQRKGGVDAASWSRSFNNGAALFKNGF